MEAKDTIVVTQNKKKGTTTCKTLVQLRSRFKVFSFHVISWLIIRSNPFSLNLESGWWLNNLGWRILQSSFYSCSFCHSQVLSYDVIMRTCIVCSDLFCFSGIILAGFPHRILPLRESGLNVVFGKCGVLLSRILYSALYSTRRILHCRAVI